MASNTLQKIVIRQQEGGIGNGHIERVSSVANILPGMLIAEDATGKVAPHAVLGGNPGLRRFAKENPHLGKTIDDAYPINDQVMIHEAQEGDIINCLLGPSQSIIKGDLIQSGGNGTVVERTTTNEVIGYADEDVTTTATNARLAVKIKL